MVHLTKQIFTHLENTLSLNKKSFAGIMRKVHSKLNLSAYFSNNPRINDFLLQNNEYSSKIDFCLFSFICFIK